MIVGVSSLPLSGSFRALIPSKLGIHRSSSPSLRLPARVSAVYASEKESCRQPTYMATSASSPCLYEALEISVGATGQEIKAAYRKLARVCHPDVVDVDRKDVSANKFMRINLAYSTLSHPEKRADYDRRLVVNQRVRHGSSKFYSGSDSYSYSAMSGFGKRTWETDQCW